MDCNQKRLGDTMNLANMMHEPLLISSILEHAARFHGEREVVSRTVEGAIHRYTYKDLQLRSKRLARALDDLAIAPGARVASLAWNTYRHLELYYGVSGSARVLHTVNPRLALDQIVYMLDQAQDQLLFFDTSFTPLIEAIAPRLPHIQAFIALTDKEHMPKTDHPKMLCYEQLLSSFSAEYQWPIIDERSEAAICYTSGTTGKPKGVVYSHRTNVLHAMAMGMPDISNFRSVDVVLPVVPMFHVNAWGVPYVVPMVGAKLVLPGPKLDPASLYELIEAEQVTMSTGVPAIWQGLLQYIEKMGLKFSTMRTAIVGGAASPPSMIAKYRELTDLTVIQGWGMTETSPVATVSRPKFSHGEIAGQALVEVLAQQGRPPFGVDIRVVNEAGGELPWDGTSAGELQVRGLWISGAYHSAEDADRFVDGWFKTGDVATIDSFGCMKITDRTKDVIKSGGEWISSIALENIALDCADVAMAAVIGLKHPKWDERPLLIVVPKPSLTVDIASLLASFEGRVERWARPDAAIQIDAMPMGATGKILKTELRTRFRDFYMESNALHT
jgi:3-(methylthio)propionyl---CoA ligase